MAGRSKVPPTATSSKAEEQDETCFILLDPLTRALLFSLWGLRLGLE